jgi:metal-dependent HD superfamily phosphatase/phosphodiesterase
MIKLVPKVLPKKVEPKPEVVKKEVKVTKKDKKEVASEPVRHQKLPPDKYAPLIENRELQVTDNMKLVFSVSRAGDEGLPHIDIRTFITSEAYTGMTKKGINFPMEFLQDFKEIINDIDEECEEKGI